MKFVGFLLALSVFFSSNPPSALGKIPEERKVTISFVGDCMIASSNGEHDKGSLNWYAENYEPTYFLEKVADIFSQDDFTVVNCETALSDRTLPRRDKGEGTNWWFIGPTSNAKIFSSSSVEIASVANNHTHDYGTEGYSDTVEALRSEGLTVAEDGVPVYFEKNGVRIGLLACGIWYLGEERLYFDALEEMCENSDFQIIYPHGGTEGNHRPEDWRRDSYGALIERGADLVVANHAHRIQPIENYKGGTIVYGLGNFCFGGNGHPHNRTAIYQCTVTKTPEGLQYEENLIPCYIYTGDRNVWQPSPVPEDDPVYQKIMDFMYGLIDDPT